MEVQIYVYDFPHGPQNIIYEVLLAEDTCAINIKFSNVYANLLITPVLSENTLMCKSCKNVEDPDSCTTFRYCKAGCLTEVYQLHAQRPYTYSFGCATKHECIPLDQTSLLFGKRDHQPVCRQCCFTNLCENTKCLNAYTTHAGKMRTHAPHTHEPHTHEPHTPEPHTHEPHTHPTHTQAPTTQAHTPNAHETHAHNTHAQTTQTFTTYAYTTQAHMTQTHTTNGLTTYSHTSQNFATTEATTPSTPAASTRDSSCRDHETATFRCSDYDKFKFCTDSSSLAYSIAHEKCAKHCGFCGLSTTQGLDIATATTTHNK